MLEVAMKRYVALLEPHILHGISRKHWRIRTKRFNGKLLFMFLHEAIELPLIWNRRLEEPSSLFYFSVTVDEVNIHFTSSERKTWIYLTQKLWIPRKFYFLFQMSSNMRGWESEVVFPTLWCGVFWRKKKKYHVSCKNKIHSNVWAPFSISWKSLIKNKKCS